MYLSYILKNLTYDVLNIQENRRKIKNFTMLNFIINDDAYTVEQKAKLKFYKKKLQN